MIWLQLTPIVSPQLIAAAPFAAFVILLVFVALLPTASLFALAKGLEERRRWLVAPAIFALLTSLGFAVILLGDL